VFRFQGLAPLATFRGSSGANQVPNQVPCKAGAAYVVGEPYAAEGPVTTTGFVPTPKK
jgi:hypothetical protein